MKTLYTLVFVLSITVGAFGQGSKLNKADKKYDKYSYIDAIEIYEKVAEKGYKSVELFPDLLHRLINKQISLLIIGIYILV